MMSEVEKDNIVPTEKGGQQIPESQHEEQRVNLTEKWLEGGGLIGWTGRNLGVTYLESQEAQKWFKEFQESGGVGGAIARGIKGLYKAVKGGIYSGDSSKRNEMIFHRLEQRMSIYPMQQTVGVQQPNVLQEIEKLKQNILGKTETRYS